MEVDGLAEGDGPLGRDLAEEEERDPCTLSSNSLYVHSLVVVVLVVHALSLVLFDFCLPGFLFHSIALFLEKWMVHLLICPLLRTWAGGRFLLRVLWDVRSVQSWRV